MSDQPVPGGRFGQVASRVVRHLRSVLYALVLAPAVWVLCGVGLTREPSGFALLPLLLGGAAYAILLFAPISPAGPALSGVVFLGAGAWALVAPDSYGSVWPSGGLDLSRPGYALAVILALPLVSTALSARRWAAYEPPQIPIIGTIGRARGRVAAPGTPMASERTALIPPMVDANGDEPTTIFPAQRTAFSEQPTEPVINADEPTAPVAGTADPTEPITEAQTTEAQTTEPITEARASEPVTQAQATEPIVDDAEPTTSVVDAGEPTAVITGEEPTASQPTRIFVTHPDGVAEERSAEEITASHQPTEPIAADEEAAAAPPGESGDRDAEEETVVPVAVATDEDGEKTQVIRLPKGRDVGAGPTRDFRGGGKTYLDGPGEQTQVIYLLEPTNADHAAQQAAKARAAEQEARDRAAQERARQAFKDRAAVERSRQAFEERAAAEARSHGEQTRIIKLPIRGEKPGGEEKTTRLPAPPPADDKTTRLPTPPPADDKTTRLPAPPPAEDEKTTVLGAPAETAEGDGEETTLLRHAAVMAEPVDGVAGEARSRSIVEQERPDPAADPTTRLIPPQRRPEEAPREPRPRSLMDLERPADES